jgi:hypothetical protein
MLALAWPALAQPGIVAGRVEDARSGEPVAQAGIVLVGTTHSALTARDGTFRLDRVPAGSYRLQVTHLGFGQQSIGIAVEAGQTVAVRITLTEMAIALQPITVEAISAEQRAIRAAGYRRGVVERADLAALEGSNMTIADALRMHVPSVRVRRIEQLVGTPVCIELRTIRATFSGECLSPKVFLDGVPVSNPAMLFSGMGIRAVERIEVVPAAEAGVRYGTGSLYGALLIESRRPGAEGDDDPDWLTRRRTLHHFDWSLEPRRHPSKRSFALGAVGGAVGLGLGILAANECIGTRAPANDRVISKCESWPTLGAAFAALSLPAVGAGLGAGFGGRTETSRGRLLPAALGGAMALLPGYALILTGKRMDSDGLHIAGITLLTLGTPLMATVADHQFRTMRRDRPVEPPRD